MFRLRITGDLGFEFWADIPGFEGYYMSSTYGRVKSVERCRVGKCGCLCPVKEKILRPSTDKGGYQIVTLRKGNITKVKKVHRLIAITFIQNPYNLPQVNHKDECKTNNRVDNLEWCTARYNTNYGTRRNRASENCKKVILQYSLDGTFIREWNSIKEAALFLGKSDSCISECANGKHSYAYGFIWRFKS